MGKNNLKFIDNHTHGAFGVNFNDANYDKIKYLLKELFKKNIRGICPTLVGDTNENIQKQLKIFNEIRLQQLESIENESLILGIHLEGSFLSPNKSGIQNKKVFLKPTIENFKSLVGKYESLIKIVTIAPEEDIDLIDYLNDKQIKTQAGHTISDKIKNCVATTHHFNAMNPIHHRDNSVALEGLIRDDIYCEIIADLIHSSENILKLFFKSKPKEKILLISDSLPSSNYNKDIVFCGKKINNLGKDKNGTLAGSNKTLDEICINLIEKNILSVDDINMMSFYNQIMYLNIKTSEIDILNR